MGKLLDSIFRKAGRAYGKTQWVLKSFTGTEEEAIQSEYALGRYLAREIIEQLEVSDNDKVNKFMRSIGVKLHAHLANKMRKFNFFILRSPEVNAFALPGGFIFITETLIDICQWDESQIAFILGHEMAHVVKGHALDRMVANSLIGVISSIGPGRGVVGGLAKKTLAKLLYSTYSHDQEMEADMFGIKIMNAAGYDPKRALTIIKKLKEITRNQNLSKIDKYFSSHPKHQIRLHNLRNFFEE